MGKKNTNSMLMPPAIANAQADAQSLPSVQRKAPCILVVTRNGHMGEPVMNYAINVADRLKYAICAVHINTLPFFCDGGRRNRLFAAAMQESVTLFKRKAQLKGVQVESLGESGKIAKVVKRLCHSGKHIEFVVIDQGIQKEAVAAQSPVPVFNVIYTTTKAGTKAGQINKADYHKPVQEGVSRMSTISKKRHVKNCFVFGSLTAGLYAAVFFNQDLVMTYFTKGGIATLLPVAVVFAVSYAHGNFTSSFWSALGIEGSKASVGKKTDSRQEVPASVDIRKDNRPRAQVNV